MRVGVRIRRHMPTAAAHCAGVCEQVLVGVVRVLRPMLSGVFADGAERLRHCGG